MSKLIAQRDSCGYELGFSVGVAAGYATLGMAGFEQRCDYTANGNGIALAPRICAEAKNGQIVISRNSYAGLEDRIDAKPLRDFRIKGVGKPVQTRVGIR